jgi:hypothetical protein
MVVEEMRTRGIFVRACDFAGELISRLRKAIHPLIAQFRLGAMKAG